MLPVAIVILVACVDDGQRISQPVAPEGEATLVDTADLDDPKLERALAFDAAPGSGLDQLVGGERTRAIVAADFDNDGQDDLFVGNPGDISYILRNVSSPGEPRFEHVQTLSDGHLSWTAAAADYDNDGDVDLFVGGGGNECYDVDQLWENQLIETGTLSFIDVRLQMGLTIEGTHRDQPKDMIATVGVRWADFDNDGLLDLYTTHNGAPRCEKNAASDSASNQLWHNEGDRFVNITLQAGAQYGGNTRHPSVFDYDQDGDLDIYNSNYRFDNVFLQNLLMETGELAFADATDGLAQRGDSVATSLESFASCTADIDNDGFEDIVVFNRPTAECSLPSEDAGAPVGNVRLHSVYRNVDGTHFEEKTEEANLRIVVNDLKGGVMGCQLGDLDGDGSIDVFVGNGGPKYASPNDLYLGTRGSFAFKTASERIRLPSDAANGETKFRTHGTIITDLDGDGLPDMLIGNGGPSNLSKVKEPQQLLMFDWGPPPTFLTVRLTGDGVAVNRDAIGARTELRLRDADGTERSLFRWVTGASCFSADNGRSLSFGLDGATPLELLITWPDGHKASVPVDAGQTRLSVAYAP